MLESGLMSAPLSRRHFLGHSSAGLAGAVLLPGVRVDGAPSFDLVVHGGMVLDGTGGPPLRVDVGVVGDTIVALGELSPEQGRRAIDASGLHVSPGFIDIHTHSDPDVLAYPTADSRVRQGVTTELAGNCGSSAAPLAGLGAEESGSRPGDVTASRPTGRMLTPTFRVSTRPSSLSTRRSSWARAPFVRAR